jgi:hypothetical protein
MTGPEQGLREIALETRMEVVIIRRPLVYGPGVNANFSAMMCGLKRGGPLSLGAIHNQRSLVARQSGRFDRDLPRAPRSSQSDLSGLRW